MIVDSSAIVAIILNEPERSTFLAALAAAPSVRMSAATWFEIAIVVESRGDHATAKLFQDMMTNLRIEVVPFDSDQALAARAAWRKYRRGRGHAARLNFGDCMAYGLAATVGEPLLFKGNDFSNTDITSALSP